MVWAALGLAGAVFALDSQQVEKTKILEGKIKELEDKFDN